MIPILQNLPRIALMALVSSPLVAQAPDQQMPAHPILGSPGPESPAPEGLAQPWLAGPYEASPETLLAAAAARPRDAQQHIHILWREDRQEIQEDGSGVTSRHVIFHVLSQPGADALARHADIWSPWRQERPILGARVITASGEERTLDPSTIAEISLGERDPTLLTDRKMLEAPLSGIEVGAIVELTSSVRTQAQPMAAVGPTLVYFSEYFPVAHRRLVVETPASLGDLHWRIEAMEEGPDGVRVTTEEFGEARRWTFTIDAAEPLDQPSLLAPDAEVIPLVTFGVAPSWNAVARHYEEIVEGQLSGADFGSLAEEATADLPADADRLERITASLAFVQKRVRYSGLEFGEGAIVPRTPAQTLQRGYGDGKDKATLLVGLLRAQGIEGHVALLSASLGGIDPVDAEIPGIGTFNRAIVYLPADGGREALWIDPTDRFARVGELPLSNTGHQALVADASTRSLLMIPESGPEPHRQEEIREAYFATSGRGRIEETTLWHGERERNQRRGYRSTGKEDLQVDLEGYAANNLLSGTLGDWSLGEPDSLAEPLRLWITVNDTARVITAQAEAVLVTWPDSLLNDLPDLLLSDPPEGDDPLAGRTQDVYLPMPYVATTDIRLHAPPGYELLDSLENYQRTFGQGWLSRTLETGTDGVPTLRYHFSTGPRRMSADDARALRAAVLKLANEEPDVLKFIHRAERSMSND